MAEMSVNSLQEAFKFPFEGKEARNRFIIGSALTLASGVIPIIPLLFVGGYLIAVMRQAQAGEKPELPAWTEWGQLAQDGLKAGVIGLVYMLPATVVFGVGFSLYLTSFLSPLLAATMERTPQFVGVSELAILGGVGALFLSMALGTLLMLLASIALPMALAHFAAQGDLAAGFRRREWWPILRRVKLAYFICWVIVMGLSSVAYVVALVGYYSLILCILTPFALTLAMYYMLLVGAALFGQTYREGTLALGAEEAGVE